MQKVSILPLHEWKRVQKSPLPAWTDNGFKEKIKDAVEQYYTSD
ncbi:hypothetical protein Lp90_0755 [Lactiplantibacillus plantarum]|nr:hypothetical protein [Lactiplantibacillus plantarum]KEZ15315.1 hypothetical protein Lp90_0755 [Lactiplantibacillus plantarum]